MSEQPVGIKAIFDPKTKMVVFTIGAQHFVMQPEQFGRMVEYLELFWSSYSSWRAGLTSGTSMDAPSAEEA